MKKTALLLITLFTFLLTLPVSASSPKWTRLSWAGNDASESMAITWNTEAPTDESIVEWGITPQLGNSTSGTSFLANDNIGTVHEVELVELSPDTQYYFRVGGAGAWSTVHSFRTAPLPGCGTMRFVVLGDNRSQDDHGPAQHWPDIYAHAISEGPDFVLDTGDLVKDGEESSQWINYLEDSSPLLPLAPHMPSLGNHDDDTQDGDYANYNQVFQLPRNHVTVTEDYYFFTWSDAFFVALSTSTYMGGSIPFQEQADWLDQVLTDNPRKWKFVYFHHPIYTSHAIIDVLFDEFELNHPPNELNQNAALVPIFDKHHVDLVFNGHNHYYERFSPMFGGGGAEQGNPVNSTDEGTVYLITGGAGAFTYDEIDLGVVEIDLTEDLLCSDGSRATGSAVCSGRHHFVVLNVEGNTLTGEVIATAAQNFDNDPDNIEVIDTFTIQKNEPVTECETTDPEPDPEPDPDPEPVEDAGSTDPSTDTIEDDTVVETDTNSKEEDTLPSPGIDTGEGQDKPTPSGDTGIEPPENGESPTRPGQGQNDMSIPEQEAASDSGCQAHRSRASLWMGLFLMLCLLLYPRRKQAVGRG